MFDLMKTEIQVKCPKCEKESPFTIYPRITSDDEGFWQKILDESLFMHECPHCRNRINVQYPFMYYKTEDHFLVHYCNSDEEVNNVVKMLTKPEAQQRQMVDQLIKDDTIIRIVRKRHHLIEKMCIYEAGMDDRVIEIMKFMFADAARKQKKDIQISDILFNVIKKEGEDLENGKKILQILSEGKIEAQGDVTDELYKKTFDDYVSAMPPMRADKNIIVNSGWARGIIQLKNSPPKIAD